MSSSRGGSRRRRSRSSSRRHQTAPLVPHQPRRRGAVGAAEVLASLGVAAVAVALIALIWVVSLRNIRDQVADVRERAERVVTAQAVTLSEEIRHELLLIDQSLSILQAAWNQDQEHFDLLAYQKQMPGLTSVASDMFVADEKQVVRQDILPQAIGQGIGGPYLNFPHGTLEILNRDAKPATPGQLLIADSVGTVEARRYLMYIVRPLASPKRWLIGASYRTEELVRLYSQVAIGINGIVALLDTQRGTVQAIAGPAARHPQTDIAKSTMLTAFKTKVSGTWTGPTAMDNVERIMGFAKVTGREMYVTVGVSQAEAMAAATAIGTGTWWVALSASLVVGATGIAILAEIFNLRANRRRQRNYARAQNDLESLQNEVGLLRTRSTVDASRVATLMRISGDGLAVLNTDLQLVAWNASFVTESGVPATVLREGLPVDELFRNQAEAGLIESLRGCDTETTEAEIARRVAILRTEPASAALPQRAPDGRMVAVYAEALPDSGGLILVLTEGEV